ncbi:uncharacterized protein LTR77_009559 [Saxophila tyrrhenica]|uniref:chitin deacetylase n=1 Tax=Saxophila tyrrhenica TaxID=1690608 RepID=A0AAV9P1V6_9PEZI|nr:hypothetical protein LTR77_009559 [Saxophila tyrrhenica]
MAIQAAAIAVVLLVVLPLYIIYKPPVFFINQLQRHSPSVLFHVPTTRKVVALTIDDSPSDYTNSILAILKANNATATFFVIGGQVSGRELILKDILLAGSELGNHGMHDEPSLNVPTPRLREEIDEVDSMINHAYETSGQNRTMHLFRPGSGIFSDRVLDVAKDAGYRTILGSIFPHDPFIPYWRVNAWHILSSLRPGAVIICHDRRSWTVPMLKKVLPEMKKRGYDVVSVSGLLLDPQNET